MCRPPGSRPSQERTSSPFVFVFALKAYIYIHICIYYTQTQINIKFIHTYIHFYLFMVYGIPKIDIDKLKHYDEGVQ